MSQRKRIRAYLNQRHAANQRFANRVTVMAVWRAVLTAKYNGHTPPAWLIIHAIGNAQHTGETE